MLFLLFFLFNLQLLAVTSGSMEPTLSTGSLVITFGSDDFKVGDIITLERDGLSVTHRIVEEGDDYYITAGDKNPTTDSAPVRKEDISGKVFLVIPFMGYLLSYLKEPFVFAVIATLIFIIGKK